MLDWHLNWLDSRLHDSHLLLLSDRDLGVLSNPHRHWSGHHVLSRSHEHATSNWHSLHSWSDYHPLLLLSRHKPHRSNSHNHPWLLTTLHSRLSHWSHHHHWSLNHHWLSHRNHTTKHATTASLSELNSVLETDLTMSVISDSLELRGLFDLVQLILDFLSFSFFEICPPCLLFQEGRDSFLRCNRVLSIIV